MTKHASHDNVVHGFGFGQTKQMKRKRWCMGQMGRQCWCVRVLQFKATGNKKHAPVQPGASQRRGVS